MFTNPAIGTVTIFAGTFAPQNWLFCQGQLLSIGEYAAMYSILGTTFGGDGVQTFALPDLRGRAAVHAGQAPGMDNYIPGQLGGNESIVLTADQLGGHTHTVTNIELKGPPASSLPGGTDLPAGNVPAVVNGAPNAYSSVGSGQNLGTTDSFTLSGAAGSTSPSPISVISPYLAMNYVICMAGIYPTQG
ncbi:MAG TPA: tail fiber protein [Puia sp.]|jgi:microcystin-dependent protein